MSRSTSRQSNRRVEQAQTPSAPAPLERDNSRSFVPLNLAILTVCDDGPGPRMAGDLLRDRVRPRATCWSRAIRRRSWHLSALALPTGSGMKRLMWCFSQAALA